MISPNSNEELFTQIAKFTRTGLGAFKTNFGKKLVGILAIALHKPPQEENNIDEYSDLSKTKEEKVKPEKSNLEKIRDTIVQKFAIGDLISVSGLFMYFLQNMIGPKKTGIVGSLFRNLSLAMTFIGSTAAAAGRTLGFDKEVMYGPEQASKMIDDAQRKGLRIFDIIEGSHPKIQNYIDQSKILDKTLIYPNSQSALILQRHEQNSVGGIFDGPPGTGKTKGVECVIGKWLMKMLGLGKIPVVAKLNMTNLNQYINHEKQKQMDVIEFYEHFAGNDGKSKGTFATNQGLMIVRGLISKIRDIKKHIEVYNEKTSGPKKELIVFVDELDKAFETSTLQGCDKRELRNLLIQFNELFDDGNLLLTMNTKLEQFMNELREHVKIDETNTGEDKVIKPMYDRLASRNRCYVDISGPKEQALIISGKVLTDYAKHIDWNDFGNPEINNNFEHDRDLFAQIIEQEITSRLGSKINGRHLNAACEQLKSLLAGKATKINSQNSQFNDNAWQAMSTEDKIEKTGAKIDKTMLSQVVESQLESMNLNQSQKDFDTAMKVFNEYLNNREVIKSLQSSPHKLISKADLDAVLPVLYDKGAHGNQVSYYARTPVKLNGKDYHHIVTQYPAQDENGPIYKVSFADLTNKSKETLIMDDFVHTKRISDSRFTNEIRPIVERAAQDPLKKVFDTLVDSFSINKKTGQVETNKSAKDLVNLGTQAMQGLGRAA